MEKILVTGSTGFIGKKLVEELTKKDYEIHVLERYVTGRYTFSHGQNVVKHHANLTDYSAIKHIIREVLPDYVLNLAAVSAVSFSYDHYIEVSEVDYLGTVNLAESCYREVPNFKQFITAGTSEEYGMYLQSTNDKLAEDAPLLPNSPYAVAKVASDYYLRYMGLAYQFPYTIMRPFNTYGRTDNSHFFIERTITQMLSGEKVTLGDPNAVRDWLYVDDHVSGYTMTLGNKKAIGETINLATGVGYTTKQTAEMIAEMSGYKGKIYWNSTPKRPLDAAVLVGDNSKAKRLLGWKPTHTLEQGLKKTIDFWTKAASKK